MKSIFYIFAAFLISTSALFSVNFPNISKGINNIGTEYMFAFHPAQDKLSKETNIRVYVVSDVATEVTVAINAHDIIETKMLEPYKITEFVIDPSKAIPVVKYPYLDPDEERVYDDYAIRVNSIEPIMCYAILDFDKAKGSIAPLATSAVGTDYIISTYPDDQSSELRMHTSYITVIGVHDNTSVNFTLGGSLGTETPGGQATGELRKVNLNKGDIWIIPGMGTRHELSGSLINASKPVSVLSGIYSYSVITSSAATDYMIEQLLPIDAWGENNLIPEFSDYQANPYVNIFAAEDNTDIYLNNDLIFNLLKSYGVTNIGFLGRELFRNTTLSNPALVSSDKNIHVSFFPNYSNYDYGVSEQIEILPMNQYEKQLMFFTPPLKTATLKYNATIIFETDPSGKIPQQLKLGEYNNELNKFDFRNVIDMNYLSFKKIADIDGKSYAYCILQISNNKVFSLASETPVIAYISDSKSSKSGAMPAQFNSKRNFSIDTAPPVITLKSINSDNKIPFTLSDSPSNLFESSRLSMIDFSESHSNNFEFEIETFIPRITHFAKGNLILIDYTKDAYAEIYATDAAGNDTVLTFSYITPKFEITTEDDFEKYSLFGEKVEKVFTITNLSDSDDLMIDNVILENDQNGFSIVDDLEIPYTLTPAGSFTVRVVFDPVREKGNYSNKLGVIIDGRNYFNYELTAEVAAPSIYVEDLDFGNVVEGGTSYLNKLVISNVGNFTAEIVDLQLSTNSFRIEIEDMPFQIEPNSKKELDMYFEPKSTGKLIDTLKVLGEFFEINGTTKDYAVLKGTGLVSSINENNANKLEISEVKIIQPNNLSLIVNSSISENATLSIVDLSGNLILESEILLNGGINSFNLMTPNLSQGVYLMNIKSSNYSAHKKIIINK